MLLPGVFANKLYDIIQKSNAEPVSDVNQAIFDYCKQQEELIYNTIKNLQIIIPQGIIVVAGPAGGMTNPLPIVINLNDCLIS